MSRRSFTLILAGSTLPSASAAHGGTATEKSLSLVGKPLGRTTLESYAALSVNVSLR